ncbi:hypothetical protein PINS_up014632 [Pythium insidiosum]|nr:hypothetical protein PINS_up014632 [Pythium insidiosum]
MADLRQRRGVSSFPADAVSEPKVSSLPSDDGLRKRRRGSHHTSVPKVTPLVVGFILFYAIFLATVGHFHTWLPEPRGLDAPRDVFSEARSRAVLETIMSFGYRPVGSKANDVLTPEYLLSQINDIKANAAADARIEIDVQRPTGAFGLNFLEQFQNIYANVTNIVVRVSMPTSDGREDANGTDALLISSHYDAAIGAGAASDDGVSIAIMVELLRYYSQQPPKHAAIVFNFNGAEETILQAAHGFITQHKWTKDIRAFINLEAAGAGGRELLFQTGSDELALAYAKGAKYPHASIIAQEVFQTGVIPADTDFRIYRDFGAIAGMDFAYIANGYVYHTRLDDTSRIQPGAIQRLGDNLVGVIHHLVNEPGRLQRVAATPHSSNTLFFDVAGITMVSMGKLTAHSLCAIVLVVALVYLGQSQLTFRERMDSMKLLGQCFMYAMGSTLLVAILLTLFAPLSWYSTPYIGAVVFIAPALAGMVDRLACYLDKQGETSAEALWRIEEGLFEAMLSAWLLGLIAMLGANLISAYAAAVWVIFPLIGQVLCHALQRMNVLSPTMYIVISLGSIAIPAFHSGFVLAVAFMFFMPLLGRSGTVAPPDIIIAVVFVLSLSIMLSYASRFFCFVPSKKLYTLRNLLMIITAATLGLSTLLNPYSDITPKRLILQHVHREVLTTNGSLQTQDSGLWVNAMDFRGLSTIRPFLLKTQWRDASLAAPPTPLLEQVDLYGDLPFALPVRDFLPERHSWYLPTAPPKLADERSRASLRVVSSHFNDATNRRKIHLHFTGPAFLHIYIDAKKTRLTSWSIGQGVNGPVPSTEGTYILQFATGIPPASFHFWIEAETNAPIEIGLTGHFLEERTPQMQEFLDALPSWVHVAEIVSTWRSQII